MALASPQKNGLFSDYTCRLHVMIMIILKRQIIDYPNQIFFFSSLHYTFFFINSFKRGVTQVINKDIIVLKKFVKNLRKILIRIQCIENNYFRKYCISQNIDQNYNFFKILFVEFYNSTEK